MIIFNPLFYLCSIICILTGYIKYFVLIMFIIFIHELGHILVSKLFKWKIDKIIILPFGGLIIFNEKIDTNLYEEFLITLSGPLLQLVITLLINNPLLNNISYSLLIFNLLPIKPLDGSKLLNIVLNKFICFRISYYLVLIISIIFIIKIFKFNLIIILVLICLIKEIIKSFKEYKYIYNKFILEKYLYKIKYKKMRKINNINSLYRNTYHLILNNNKYYLEEDYIKNIINPYKR